MTMLAVEVHDGARAKVWSSFLVERREFGAVRKLRKLGIQADSSVLKHARNDKFPL